MILHVTRVSSDPFLTHLRDSEPFMHRDSIETEQHEYDRNKPDADESK